MNPITSKATRIFAALVAAALLLSACSDNAGFEMVGEVDDPVYRRAKDLYDRGMENEALENYLKLIQIRNGNAPESHLDAGNIYLNHMRDPISAIYHFMRYKSLVSRSRSPESEERIELVDDLIKTAKKEFAASLDMKVYRDPLERLKLLDTIEQLRSENELLKSQLADARTRLNRFVEEDRSTVARAQATEPPRPQRQAAPTRVEPRPAQVEAQSDEARSYTIQPGDSLYRIARQVYGDGGKWRQILEANRSVIPDPGNLKVGTQIVLP